MGERMCPKYEMPIDMTNCIGCEALKNEECKLQNEEWRKKQKERGQFINSFREEMYR